MAKTTSDKLKALDLQCLSGKHKIESLADIRCAKCNMETIQLTMNEITELRQKLNSLTTKPGKL